jgi:hypothetical protein
MSPCVTQNQAMRRFVVVVADQRASELRQLSCLHGHTVREHIADILEAYIRRSRKRLKPPGLVETPAEPAPESATTS